MTRRIIISSQCLGHWRRIPGVSRYRTADPRICTRSRVGTFIKTPEHLMQAVRHVSLIIIIIGEEEEMRISQSTCWMGLCNMLRRGKYILL